MNDPKAYRITTRRPIGGRMRQVGEIVALTEREAAAELPWGGLSPVTAEPVAEPAVEAATEAKAATAPAPAGRKGA
jgi:hypothetical protein